jgi:redox-sensitive bicupin YhaK (pirin superfamily)
MDGSISTNGIALKKGDAAKIYEEDKISIQAEKDSQIMLFDLPMDF